MAPPGDAPVSSSKTVLEETTESIDSPWKDVRIIMVMLAMGASKLLSAMDLTAISTTLPTIANDIGLEDYVWAGSGYALASTVVLPLFGSLTIAFGRRLMLCLAIVIFAIGSAICGSAHNQSAMIAGRTIQGVGGGGVLAITDILTADIFPLAIPIALFGLVWVFASGIGPPIGGAFAESDWRWLFYMNLPLSAVVLLLVIIYCNFQFPKTSTKEKLTRFDYTGNALFLMGATAVVLALTWAGHPYAFSSTAVLVPLLVGLAMMASLGFVERTAVEPALPLQLLSNRTSAIGYATCFVHLLLVLAIVYYLPVYFQLVKQDSAVVSGIHLFPLSFTIAPAAVVASVIVGKTQRYKELNIASWAGTTVGFGLMTLIKENSSAGYWAGTPIVVGISTGMLYTATIYPISAPLPVNMGAQVMSFYAFAQQFGQVFGITLGSVVLQNDLPRRLPDPIIQQLGFQGDVYTLIPAIESLSASDQTQVKTAVTDSLRIVWIACVGFSGLGLFLSVWMKALPLGNTTDERYALKTPQSIDQNIVSNTVK